MATAAVAGSSERPCRRLPSRPRPDMLCKWPLTATAPAAGRTPARRPTRLLAGRRGGCHVRQEQRGSGRQDGGQVGEAGIRGQHERHGARVAIVAPTRLVEDVAGGGANQAARRSTGVNGPGISGSRRPRSSGCSSGPGRKHRHHAFHDVDDRDVRRSLSLSIGLPHAMPNTQPRSWSAQRRVRHLLPARPAIDQTPDHTP